MRIEKIQLSDPTVTADIYLRENVSVDSTQQPAVIICPGGGYNFLSDRESEPMALAFLAQGYQAIVFNYPVIADNSELSPEYLDKNGYLLGEVFRLIEQNQLDWQIQPESVFVLGCSAGGHLASLYATQWQKFSSTDDLKLAKPLGSILCYPVIGFDYGWPLSLTDSQSQQLKSCNTSTLVNQETPSTFIWHTANDASVPVLNTLKYCQGLATNKIDFECHIFEDGKHGLALANRASAKFHDEAYIRPEIAEWFGKCVRWMERKLADSKTI